MQRIRHAAGIDGGGRDGREDPRILRPRDLRLEGAPDAQALRIEAEQRLRLQGQDRNVPDQRSEIIRDLHDKLAIYPFGAPSVAVLVMDCEAGLGADHAGDPVRMGHRGITQPLEGALVGR